MNNGSGMGGPSQSLRSGDPPALSRSLSPHSPGMPSFSATPHSSTTPTLHTTGHEASDSDGTPPASSSPSVSASPIPSMEDPHTRPASSQAHEALDSQGTAAKEVVGPKAREAQAGEPSSSAVLDPGLVPGGATVSPGLSPSRELTSRPMSVSVDGQFEPDLGSVAGDGEGQSDSYGRGELASPRLREEDDDIVPSANGPSTQSTPHLRDSRPPTTRTDSSGLMDPEFGVTSAINNEKSTGVRTLRQKLFDLQEENARLLSENHRLQESLQRSETVDGSRVRQVQSLKHTIQNYEAAMSVAESRHKESLKKARLEAITQSVQIPPIPDFPGRQDDWKFLVEYTQDVQNQLMSVMAQLQTVLPENDSLKSRWNEERVRSDMLANQVNLYLASERQQRRQRKGQDTEHLKAMIRDMEVQRELLSGFTFMKSARVLKELVLSRLEDLQSVAKAARPGFEVAVIPALQRTANLAAQGVRSPRTRVDTVGGDHHLTQSAMMASQAFAVHSLSGPPEVEDGEGLPTSLATTFVCLEGLLGRVDDLLSLGRTHYLRAMAVLAGQEEEAQDEAGEDGEGSERQLRSPASTRSPNAISSGSSTGRTGTGMEWAALHPVREYPQDVQQLLELSRSGATASSPSVDSTSSLQDAAVMRAPRPLSSRTRESTNESPRNGTPSDGVREAPQWLGPGSPSVVEFRTRGDREALPAHLQPSHVLSSSLSQIQHRFSSPLGMRSPGGRAAGVSPQTKRAESAPRPSPGSSLREGSGFMSSRTGGYSSPVHLSQKVHNLRRAHSASRPQPSPLPRVAGGNVTAAPRWEETADSQHHKLSIGELAAMQGLRTPRIPSLNLTALSSPSTVRQSGAPIHPSLASMSGSSMSEPNSPRRSMTTPFALLHREQQPESIPVVLPFSESPASVGLVSPRFRDLAPLSGGQLSTFRQQQQQLRVRQEQDTWLRQELLPRSASTSRWLERMASKGLMSTPLPAGYNREGSQLSRMRDQVQQQQQHSRVPQSPRRSQSQPRMGPGRMSSPRGATHNHSNTSTSGGMARSLSQYVPRMFSATSPRSGSVAATLPPSPSPSPSQHSVSSQRRRPSPHHPHRKGNINTGTRAPTPPRAKHWRF